jgi:hypothetical protein
MRRDEISFVFVRSFVGCTPREGRSRATNGGRSSLNGYSYLAAAFGRLEYGTAKMTPLFPGEAVEGALELVCCFITAVTAVFSFVVTQRL